MTAVRHDSSPFPSDALNSIGAIPPSRPSPSLTHLPSLPSFKRDPQGMVKTTDSQPENSSSIADVAGSSETLASVLEQAPGATPAQASPEEFNAVVTSILAEATTEPQRSVNGEQKPGHLLQRMGLKTKVTIAAIALSALPAIGIGSIAYVQAGSTIATQIQADKQNRATSLTRRLQAYMGFRLTDIEDLTTRLIFRDPFILEEQGTAAITQRLNQFLARSTVYDSLAFFDLDGNVIVQSDGPKLPNIAATGYFQAAVTTGEKTYTTPQHNEEINESAVFIAAPIRRFGSTEIIGVVRLRLPQSSLFASVADIQTEVDDIYIMDRHGNYILTPSSERDLIGQNLEITFPKLWPNIDQQPFKTVTVQDKAGQHWLVSSSRSQVESNLLNPQWTGIIKTPVADAFQVKRQLLLTLLLGVSTTTAFSLALAIYLSNRTTRPLLDAAEAVTKIGQGDLETRLDVPAQGDELVQLGQNINLMGDQLKTFFEQQTWEAELAQLLGELARVRSLEEFSLLLNQTMLEMQRQVGGDRIIFQRIEPSDGRRSVIAEAVLSQFPSVQGASSRAFSESEQETFNNQQTLVLNDIQHNDLSQEHRQELQDWGVQSLLATPVFVNNDLYGILSVHACATAQTWQPQDSDTLIQLGNRLSLALGAFESFNQVQEQAQAETKKKETLQFELLTLLSDVEEASTGDLTVRAQITDGEIGIVADFFNAIIENLRDVVSQVKTATTQVNTSVSGNDASIRKLAADATTQAEQVLQTLGSIEDMTLSLQAVAHKAKRAARASQQAAHTAQAGGKAMETTVDSIFQVRQTIAETAKKVKRLGESSQQISKVVELINQIALKTNLLAVNAGIEAARAGEEGRGFAVVAEEVGALAAQSASATQEIEQIIDAIQRGTSEVVEAMETSTSQVVEGTRSVETAKESLNAVLKVSRQVNQVFQVISTETSNQVETSEAVKQLMGQMASVSQETSAASQAVSESLQETVQITEQLQSSVGEFKVAL